MKSTDVSWRPRRRSRQPTHRNHVMSPGSSGMTAVQMSSVTMYHSLQPSSSWTTRRNQGTGSDRLRRSSGGRDRDGRDVRVGEQVLRCPARGDSPPAERWREALCCSHAVPVSGPERFERCHDSTTLDSSASGTTGARPSSQRWMTSRRRRPVPLPSRSTARSDRPGGPRPSVLTSPTPARR